MKPGTRLQSAVCDTEVMIIKIAAGVIGCGGSPMVEKRAGDKSPIDPAMAGSSVMGKRYTDAGGTIELLCVKPGQGTLALNGVSLQLKDAKPLPASD